MKPTIFVALLAALVAAGSASAQSATKMSAMPGMRAAEAHKATGQGVGVVKAVDMPGHKITIAHGPIPAIGWPGMTMTFNAKSARNLGAIKVGQTVGFALDTKSGAPEVTHIVPRKSVSSRSTRTRMTAMPQKRWRPSGQSTVPAGSISAVASVLSRSPPLLAMR